MTKISYKLVRMKYLTTHMTTCKSDVSLKHARITSSFFINTIKKQCEKHMLLKQYILLTCLKDTCHFYMWIVGYFLQTDL
jgi:hypothetical protein